MIAADACDRVKLDEIWRDHISTENVSIRKNWPETWGFLVKEYKEMNEELDGVPTPLAPRQRTVLMLQSHIPKLPPVPIKEPVKGKKIPRTTTELMGWHYTRQGPHLEIYGQYARRYVGFLKEMRWPHDSVW